MTPTIGAEQRSAFYRAALLGLRTLDSSERTPRRFGSDADARWRSFQGHLGVTERLDLLIRDAAVTWASGFSPAIVFGLPGLAADEPFGPDWTGLPEHEAKRLWSDESAPSIGAVCHSLGSSEADVQLPEITASTQLTVAGGAAINAVALHFDAHRELKWSHQVIVVAESPTIRQFAGLIAPLLQAEGCTRLVHPSSEVRSCLKKLGMSSGGHAVISDDATEDEQSFVREATRGS